MMKRVRWTLALLMALSLGTCHATSQAGTLVTDQSGSTVQVAAALAQAAPCSVVVQLRDGASISDVEHATNGTEIVGYPDLGLYLLQLPCSASLAFSQEVTTLQKTPGVDYGEPDQNVVVPEVEQSSMSHHEGGRDDDGVRETYVDQPALHLLGAARAQRYSTGQGVIVATIDTGAALDHPDLQGQLASGYNVLDPSSPPADTTAPGDDDPSDAANAAVGHGTAVAGIIALIAPNAGIMPVKVLDSSGEGTTLAVALGIRYAVDHGAQVINMSLGMPEYSKAIARALAYAAKHNVVLIGSAGNTGDTTYHYPSDDPNVLSVAATDDYDQKAPFSSYGPYVGVSAPGVDITSTDYDGGYGIWSGTSMSAPFVAGEAALLLALQPNAGMGQTYGLIESAANPIPDQTYAGELGSGRVCLPAAVAPAGQVWPCPLHVAVQTVP